MLKVWSIGSFLVYQWGSIISHARQVNQRFYKKCTANHSCQGEPLGCRSMFPNESGWCLWFHLFFSGPDISCYNTTPVLLQPEYGSHTEANGRKWLRLVCNCKCNCNWICKRPSKEVWVSWESNDEGTVIENDYWITWLQLWHAHYNSGTCGPPKKLRMRKFVQMNNNTYHMQIVIAHVRRNVIRHSTPPPVSWW